MSTHRDRLTGNFQSRAMYRHIHLNNGSMLRLHGISAHTGQGTAKAPKRQPKLILTMLLMTSAVRDSPVLFHISPRERQRHRHANCKTQAKKVDELLARGAQVYLTTGNGGFNSYDGAQHRKGAVLDDDVVWSGSSNLTRASRANLKLVHRFQNCDAADETERLLRQALRGAVMLKGRM